MTDADLLVLRRRFVLLTALRWLPTGLLIPVLVLLLRARGMSLPTIGVLFAVYSVTTLLLELPTGGLADVIGRRTTLLASATVTLVSMFAFAFGQRVPALVLGMLLSGVGRALDSGPLEAWYVDAAHSLDPRADLKPALARAAGASAIALAVGSLAGGGIVAVAPLPDSGDGVLLSLSVPYLAAALVGGLSMIATFAWVGETRAPSGPTGWRSVVRDVPRTVRAGTRLAVGSRVLRRLSARAAVMGIVLTTAEVLSPVEFADTAGVEGYAVLVTIAFVGTAAGARLGPGLARLAGGSGRGLLVATALVAAGVAGVALPGWWAAGAYIALYAVLGLDDPLVGDLLHAETGPQQRATVLSVQSLLLMTGGVVGNLAVPALAATTGLATTWLVVAGVTLVASLLAIGLPAGRLEGDGDLAGEHAEPARLAP